MREETSSSWNWSVWELKNKKRESLERIRLVKLTYRSKGRNLAKKLFGYGPWKEVKRGKVYRHKRIIGALEGLPVRKCGRACLIVPRPMLSTVQRAIVQHGGEIRRITPVVIPVEEVEVMADRYYADYLRMLRRFLKKAYEAENKADFQYALEGASRLTKRFEALIKEASEYTGEKPEVKSLHGIFDGLKSISSEDFEAAKLQVEFLVKNMEKEWNSLLKSLSK